MRRTWMQPQGLCMVGTGSAQEPGGAGGTEGARPDVCKSGSVMIPYDDSGEQDVQVGEMPRTNARQPSSR